MTIEVPQGYKPCGTSLLIQRKDIYLAGVPLIPERGKDLKLLEAAAEIEPIGAVIHLVLPHLHGLDLHEFVPRLAGVGYGGVHQRTAIPLAVAGLQNTHDRKLHGAVPRLLKTEKAHRYAIFLADKAGLIGGVGDIPLRSGGDAEPLRQL